MCVCEYIYIYIYIFPGSSAVEFTCHAGDMGSILKSGRSPGGGHGNPLKSSWPGKSRGQRSLVSSPESSRGHKESDTTEQLTHTHTHTHTHWPECLL